MCVVARGGRVSPRGRGVSSRVGGGGGAGQGQVQGRVGGGESLGPGGCKVYLDMLDEEVLFADAVVAVRTLKVTGHHVEAQVGEEVVAPHVGVGAPVTAV